MFVPIDGSKGDVRYLRELRLGQEAVVMGLEGGEGAYRAKLLAMGLTRGTKIRLIRSAPLGDPLEIEVRGFRLTLRKYEADLLRIAVPKADDLDGQGLSTIA